MHGYLESMLDMLTSAYAKEPTSNIGKLFSIFADGLEEIHENNDMIRLYHDIDNAIGYTLDKWGANVGVKRNGAGDYFYRLLIKTKLMSLISGSDVDTVINGAAAMFSTTTDKIRLEEPSPATIRIYVNAADIGSEGMNNIALVHQILKQIVAAGINIHLYVCTAKEIETNQNLHTTHFMYSNTIINPKES